MGRKMPDLLGEIGAVDVLFQRLVDECRNHEAERHVDEHVAAVVDCGIEIRIRKRGVKELRRLIDLVDRDAADEMDDKAYLILRQRKKEALARQLNPTPTTINNSFTSINISPEVMKQAELAASKQIIQESEIKTLDLTNEGKEND